ncbi:MAG: translation initiation factor IF-3 [Candidatus Dojkabacteria bacterium]
MTTPRLMVIDELGNNLGEMDRLDALNLAKSKELDLIIVSAKEGSASVAKIGDIAKSKYEKTKKLRKSKGKSSEMKEWWFKPSIQERDLVIRLEKIKKFLSKGGTAKLTVKFVKKTMPAQMGETMAKITQNINMYAKPISDVAREGKNLSIIVKAL